MTTETQAPDPAPAEFPAPDLRGIDGATLGEWRMLGLPAKAVLVQEKDLPTIIERACRAYEASSTATPAGYVTAVEEGKVLMLPRPSLNTAGLVPIYAGPIQAPEGALRTALELLVNYCAKRGFDTETVSAAYLAEARAALAAPPTDNNSMGQAGCFPAAERTNAAHQAAPQRYSPTGDGGMEIDSLGDWVKFQPAPKEPKA